MTNTSLCAIVLSGMLLLNACKKEAAPTPASSSTTATTVTGAPSNTTTGTAGATPTGTNNGTTTGTTNKAGISYALRATSTTAGIAQKTSAGGSLQWTGGFANPREIRFEAKLQNSGSGNGNSGSGNNGKIEYRATGTGQVDLFTAAAALFATTPLPTGTYKEIELHVKLEKTGTTPSLQLTGVYSDSAITALPVVLQITDVCEIRTEVEDVTIDSTTALDATMLLSLANLTNGSTETAFASAQLTNGTLVISATSNAALYAILLNNLRSGRHDCDVQPHH